MHKNKKHKQEGGLLIGPSHEEGGIGAVVSGGEEVELEGGEYIINAQTVDALGTEFLDKINSTQTTYHTGGFGPNELPSPSKYANGGQIRRNNMRRRRKFAHGGYHGDNPYLTGQQGNPYRKGGGIRRKMGHGGMMRNGNGCPAGMHMMPDGSCMEGAYHGASNSYRHGGFHPRPRPGGPGMPPPSIPDIMSSGGMGMGNTVQGMRMCGGTGQNAMGSCPPGMVCTQGVCMLPEITINARGASQSYRRGGRPRRRFAHGGYHSNGMRNGCGPGEMCHGGMMQYEHGGGVNVGSPNSCTDGMGNNVPC